MNGELLRIVDAIHRDKNIAKEIVFEGIEAALLSAAKKRFSETDEITITVDRETGKPTITKNSESLNPEALGDILGRIPAQAAKQVMIQKIREAERDAIYDEFNGKVNRGKAEIRAAFEPQFRGAHGVIRLSGVETMDEAETLAGAELWMPADALAPLPEGTYYRHDLVGCEVTDASGAAIGRVCRVEGTLERSYLVVNGARGDVMIPMVAQICVNVDMASKHIMVALPDGLIEVNATSGRRPADRGERRAHSDPSTGSGSPRATSRGE